MTREPGEAGDLDFPVVRTLVTRLDTYVCHTRLASYVKPISRVGSGRDEPGQAADGWDLVGEVSDYGFDIAQRVIESPLPFDRVASGVCEEAGDGPHITFRMVFNPGARAHPREDRAAFRVQSTLNSARWAAFDADGVDFHLDISVTSSMPARQRSRPTQQNRHATVRQRWAITSRKRGPSRPPSSGRH